MKRKASFKKKIIGTASALFLSLFALYIFQVNALTSHAYAITASEKLAKELLQNQRNLETADTKLLSFSAMATLAQKLQFEKTDTVRYIQVVSNSVARLPSANQ